MNCREVFNVCFSIQGKTLYFEEALNNFTSSTNKYHLIFPRLA